MNSSGYRDLGTSTSKNNDPVTDFCNKVNNCDQNAANPISHAKGMSVDGKVQGGCQVIESLAVLNFQIINHHTQIRVHFT